MIDQKKRPHPSETSSLLLLKLALAEAEKESPARPPKKQKDVNEELALKLIAGMEKNYRKVNVVASAIARNNPLLIKGSCQGGERAGVASPAPFVRNDIRLEP